MKKVRKLILIGVVLVVLVVLSVPFWIDRAGRVGVERGSEYALGVPTSLGEMDIGLLAGSTELGELKISNPPGFDTDHFLTLGQGRVAISLGSLVGDTVEVPEFSLENIDLNLEKNTNGSNFKVIMDNLARFESKESKPEPREEDKKFIVRHILIKNIKVNANLSLLGSQATKTSVLIPEIRLENVGSDSNKGVILADLVDVLLKAIMTAAIEEGGGIIPADMLGELKGSLASLESIEKIGASLVVQADGKLKELSDQATDVVKQAGEKTDATAKDLTDKAKSAQDNLTKGLQGLLPGKEEKKP